MDQRDYGVRKAKWAMTDGLRRAETAVEKPPEPKIVPHPQPAAEPVVTKPVDVKPVIVEQEAVQEKIEPKFSITTSASTIREITGQEVGLWQRTGLEPIHGAVINLASTLIFTIAIHPDQLTNTSVFSYTGFDPKGEPNIVLVQDDMQIPEFRMRPADAVRTRRLQNGISNTNFALNEFLKLSKASTSVETVLLAKI